MSDLVIFDLDGVLVDTQDAENNALAYLGELMGLSIGRAERDHLFAGKKMQECIDLMEEMSALPPPPNAMSIVRAKCEELLGPRLEPIDGVEHVLGQLDCNLCVASNSPPEIIQHRLRSAGVLHNFGNRLFSAYEIGAWKPDPRLFLWAAAECSADAKDCVVIEDSLAGIDAALGGGMQVLQFNTDPSVQPHRKGVVTFSSMSRLPELVRHARTSPSALSIPQDGGRP